MSNSSAIAAVTATIRNLIDLWVRADPALADTRVTTLSMDKARTDAAGPNQVNLFLYQVVPNPAFRNADMPRQVRAGETSAPPLALNLYYLVTAYGHDNDVKSHQLLGRTMQLFHDHPLLGSDEIRTALKDNDLFAQVERVRLTLQPLSTEEIFKLWSGFQTQYRLSAAYEASVVLIESARSTRTPLPILTRGPGDTGIAAQPDTTSPFPSIDAITLPNGQASALIGDLLTITGSHLEADAAVVVFQPPGTADAIRVPADPATATGSLLTAKVDPTVKTWVVGPYAVSVEISTNPAPKDKKSKKAKGDPVVTSTNKVWISLAPTIADIKATRTGTNAAITLTCDPKVAAGQRVSLLFDAQEFLADPIAAPTREVKVAASGVRKGEYFARLRVDGVDSLLVDRSSSPPTFRADQKVVIR